MLNSLHVSIDSLNVVAALAYLVGGFDSWLKTLSLFMLLDIFTGILKAIMLKSEKSETGGLNSSIMWKGGGKKVLTLVLVVIATMLSELIEPETLLLRSAVITYYIATEALSIVENAGACGLPLPEVLIKALEKIQEGSQEE